MTLACSPHRALVESQKRTKFFNLKLAKSAIRTMAIYFCLIAVCCAIPLASNAAEGDSLTRLFETTAFSGSWEVFEKFNLLGYILQFLISAFCLIGLVCTVARVTLTILYKSSENLFDRVHAVHQKATGPALGIPTLAKDIFNGGGGFGVGADAFVSFCLYLIPDIVIYSDYNPDGMAYNLQKDDTLTVYFLKISLPTIFTIFFFTIGFNGTLWRAYGNVVDAMAVVAEKAVTVDLASYVNRALNAGAYYQFSYDTSNAFGKLQKEVATSMYLKLLLKSDDLSTPALTTLGQNVSHVVNNVVTKSMLDDRLNNGPNSGKISQNDKYASNLKCDVTINSTPVSGDAKGSSSINGLEACFEGNEGFHVVVPLSTFGLTNRGDATGSASDYDAEEQFMHIILYKKSFSTENMYAFKNEKIEKKATNNGNNADAPSNELESSVGDDEEINDPIGIDPE